MASHQSNKRTEPEKIPDGGNYIVKIESQQKNRDSKPSTTPGIIFAFESKTPKSIHSTKGS